jgi:transmembrane sensor
VTGFERRNRRLQAAQEAADWLLALQADEASDADRAEFIDWLRESSVHVAELLHVARLHRGLATFGHWSEIIGQPERAELRAERVVTLSPPLHQALAGERRRRLVTGRRLAVAAAVAAIGVAAALFAMRFGGTLISTQSGERREVTLADGSAVDLAPDSEIRVRLLTQERLVLLGRGEVLFHVASNPRRPFIVTAADTQVRAVGTAFDVQRRPDDVAVTVVEGVVSVTTRAPNGHAARAAPLSLAAGNRVVISTATGAAGAVRRVRGGTAIAWVTNQLSFDNEPVADVVSSFNRYNQLQIQVLDPTLAGRRISGSFRTTDPESFVAFIKSVTGVAVVHRSANVILLGSRPAAVGAPTR